MTMESIRHSVEVLERALRLAPDDPMSLAMWAEFSVSEILYRFGEIDEDHGARMVEASNAAVQALPRGDYAYCARALVRIVVQRNFSGARQDLDRGEQNNPGFMYFDLYRGWLELVSEAPGKALCILKARWLKRRQDVNWLLASYLAAIGAILDHQFIEAVAILEDAIEARPACKAYHILLAEAWSGAGDKIKAEAVLSAAARIPHLPDMAAPYLELPGEGAALMAKLTPNRC
jgi:predicted Zn-dependent protease